MTAKMDIEFSDREQRILKLLVDHYISDGQPVGSRTLSRMPGIDISAASVRNVMGDLEQMGLLKSPHTSAGRIPTSKAWRVFVDTMLEVQTLDNKAIHEFRQVLDPKMSEQALVKAASNYLSGFTRMAGMVTVPKHEGKALQQVEFLPLSDRRILAILIMNDSEIQNRIIHVDRDYKKEELEAFSKQLNAEYLGKSLQEMRDLILSELQNRREAMSDSMQFMIDVAGEVFVEPDNDGDNNDMIVAGETNLMRHADLNNMETLKELFDAFNSKRDIYHLLEQCVSAEGVQIFIGRESGYDALGECSLVTAPYESEGSVLGVLGVVGPKRMAYDQVIPIVDVAAELLSAALNSRT